MNHSQVKAPLALACATAAFSLAALTGPSLAGEGSWKAETIADALRAAPSAVTRDAAIFGWTSDAKLTLARHGTGPYTCVASGSFSLRLGKPPLPYPDPMCLDRNAWSFLQALWGGPGADGTAGPVPRAPGLVWMLAGMNVSKDAVDVGAERVVVTQGTTEQGSADVVRMTPHVMIMPLPFDETVAGMTTSYRLDDPLAAWIMAAGKAHEHLMVHFSAEDTTALMEVGD